MAIYYVCADVHGQYDYFMEMLDKIDFQPGDHMYILGDVIDRGPEPIKLLEYIFEQENMTLLIGNHEHMMIQALLKGDQEQLSLWMYNAGEITLKQYEKLSPERQLKILFRLYRSPLVIPNLTAGDQTFYLAHANHLLEYRLESLRYCDADKAQIERVVWSREYKNPDTERQAARHKDLYSRYKNTILIIGHSPTFICSYRKMTREGRPMISRYCSGHLINIDCGCARGLPLASLRLDDLTEFYGDIPDGMKIVMTPNKRQVGEKTPPIEG